MVGKNIIGWVGNLATKFKWHYEGEKRPRISDSENPAYKSTGNYVKKGRITGAGKKKPYKKRNNENN